MTTRDIQNLTTKRTALQKRLTTQMSLPKRERDPKLIEELKLKIGTIKRWCKEEGVRAS